MSYTWDDAAPKPDLRVSQAGRVLVAIRSLALLIWFVVMLVVSLIGRLVERPVFGAQRPITLFLGQVFFAGLMAILGIRVRTEGAAMRGAGMVVANHSSWLDIGALHARHRVYFVSKDDVAGWPGIGQVVRFSGTVVIKRDRRASTGQIAELRERMQAGHRLAVFPEGTSSDGQRVLPFKPTLFAAFDDPALQGNSRVQPVTIVFRAPKGADPRFYAWWGDMDLGPHFLKIASTLRQGSVRIIFHDPLELNGFSDRKALAAHCEAVIRARFESERAAGA